MNTPPCGMASGPGLRLPDVTMILTGGQRSLTAAERRKPVHRARHVDIGKHDVDRRLLLEQRDRLVCIACLVDREPRIAQFVGDGEQQQCLVFDDKYDLGSIRHSAALVLP